MQRTAPALKSLSSSENSTTPLCDVKSLLGHLALQLQALSIHQLQRETLPGVPDAGGEPPVLLQNRLCPHPRQPV